MVSAGALFVKGRGRASRRSAIPPCDGLATALPSSPLVRPRPLVRHDPAVRDSPRGTVPATPTCVTSGLLTIGSGVEPPGSGPEPRSSIAPVTHSGVTGVGGGSRGAVTGARGGVTRGGSARSRGTGTGGTNSGGGCRRRRGPSPGRPAAFAVYIGRSTARGTIATGRQAAGVPLAWNDPHVCRASEPALRRPQGARAGAGRGPGQARGGARCSARTKGSVRAGRPPPAPRGQSPGAARAP